MLSQSRNPIIGRQWKGEVTRRCDLEDCRRAVNNGYVVNDSDFKGFFCGAPHARVAHSRMEDLKKKSGLE